MPIFTVPIYERELTEFNKCHNPAGPGGGQFCSDDPEVEGAEGYQQGFPGAQASALASARTALLRESFEGDTVRETMSVVRADGVYVGKLLVGDEDTVAVPDAIWREWIAQGPVVTAHTHPGSSTFSFDDFRLHTMVNQFGRIENVKGPLAVTAMQVYGEDGSWYEIRFTDVKNFPTLQKIERAFTAKRDLVHGLANAATTAWAKQQPWWATRPPKTWDLMTEVEHIRYAAEKAGAFEALEAQHARHFRDRAKDIWTGLAAQFGGFEYRYHLAD